MADIFGGDRSGGINTIGRDPRSRVRAVSRHRMGGYGGDIIVLPVDDQGASRVFFADRGRSE